MRSVQNGFVLSEAGDKVRRLLRDSRTRRRIWITVLVGVEQREASETPPLSQDKACQGGRSQTASYSSTRPTTQAETSLSSSSAPRLRPIGLEIISTTS